MRVQGNPSSVGGTLEGLAGPILRKGDAESVIIGAGGLLHWRVICRGLASRHYQFSN
jgi:hypothetical protein